MRSRGAPPEQPKKSAYEFAGLGGDKTNARLVADGARLVLEAGFGDGNVATLIDAELVAIGSSENNCDVPPSVMVRGRALAGIEA
jgi:hypothetical protein